MEMTTTSFGGAAKAPVARRKRVAVRRRFMDAQLISGVRRPCRRSHREQSGGIGRTRTLPSHVGRAGKPSCGAGFSPRSGHCPPPKARAKARATREVARGSVLPRRLLEADAQSAGNAYLRYFQDGGGDRIQAITVAQGQWEERGAVDKQVSQTNASGGIKIVAQLT